MLLVNIRQDIQYIEDQLSLIRFHMYNKFSQASDLSKKNYRPRLFKKDFTPSIFFTEGVFLKKVHRSFIDFQIFTCLRSRIFLKILACIICQM